MCCCLWHQTITCPNIIKDVLSHLPRAISQQMPWNIICIMLLEIIFFLNLTVSHSGHQVNHDQTSCIHTICNTAIRLFKWYITGVLHHIPRPVCYIRFRNSFLQIIRADPMRQYYVPRKMGFSRSRYAMNKNVRTSVPYWTALHGEVCSQKG